MTSTGFPIVLFDIICEFAYNCPCKKDMELDIEYQRMVQKNIPVLFFTQCVPTMPTFHSYPCEPSFVWRRRHAQYCELFTYNPFRKGNPYFPTNGIHQHAKIWSHIPIEVCQMLENKVVRRARKYKGSLVKNIRAFMNITYCWLENWNTLLRTVFCHDFWYDESSYHAPLPLERELIRMWVSGLKEAGFGSA